MITIMLNSFVEQLVAGASGVRRVDRGVTLFHEGDRVEKVFVIDQGLVELIRRQPDGAWIILQRASRGAVLAESSLYSQHYHCDAVAACPSTVFQLPKRAVLERLDEDLQLAREWAAWLAREVRAVRTRCEILSRKTVAERVDGWLLWHENRLPEKGQWKSMALEIGVSPEALYRELAKRGRKR